MNMIIKSILLFGVFTSLFAQNTFQADSIEKWIRNGQKDYAQNILLPLYEENDEDPEINYYLGRIALLDTLYDDAIDYLDVALESDENNTDYLYLLGNAYRYKAQLSGVLTATFAAPKIKSNWEKVLELEPAHLNANWGMFQFYLNAPGIMGGSEEEAFKLATGYIARDPAGGHAMLASYYFTQEDMDQSEQELIKSMNSEIKEESARDIHNTNSNTLNQMGYYSLGESDFDKSYKYFKWAIKNAPEQANPYDSMGDHFNAVANYDSALFYYQSALNIDPNFAPSNFNKGQMLERLGKIDLAITAYRQLIEKLPGNEYADRAKERLEEIGDLELRDR